MVEQNGVQDSERSEVRNCSTMMFILGTEHSEIFINILRIYYLRDCSGVFTMVNNADIDLPLRRFIYTIYHRVYLLWTYLQYIKFLYNQKKKIYILFYK